MDSRRSLVVLAWTLALAGPVAGQEAIGGGQRPAAAWPAGPAPGATQTYFADVTDPAFGGRYPGSVSMAWGDYDNDGWPDLLVCGVYPALRTMALWHNEGNGRFADHTAALQAEVAPRAKGSGVVFADYDNDGDLDGFVAVGGIYPRNAGRNLLLRNERGAFTDVGRDAGLTDSWPTDDAVGLDYDRDGHLDYYTGNVSVLPSLRGDPSLRNRLYRNQGDGTFADATRSAGLDLQLSGSGGTNSGVATADLNDDGWPDLYIAEWYGHNRLFVNDGRGGFADATTAELRVEWAWDVAVGDVDNDGDLDLYQNAVVGDGAPDKSPALLLNLGAGQFAAVTGSAGLSGRTGGDVAGVGLADVDNDGDLDLLTGTSAAGHLLYLNDGTGYFTDASPRLGMAGLRGFPLLGDYDRDGFLDVCFAWFLQAAPWPDGLYRNQGNGNHWLEVELVGVRSNRSAIGARLIAMAGRLRQTREILAGTGLVQDELLAHFGLGERTQVDELEIRWPSGQVDVLADVPADQTIRVFEGQGSYWPVQPSTAEWTDTLVVGSAAEFVMGVHPGRYDPEARIRQVVADLRQLGGDPGVPLTLQADGTYALRVPLPPPSVNAQATVSVLVEQDTRLGPHWSRVTRAVALLPAGDLAVFGEALAPGWTAQPSRAVEVFDPAATAQVHEGVCATAIRGKASFAGWSVRLEPGAAVPLFGYPCLRLAFHPGDAAPPSLSPRFTLRLGPGQAVDLLAGGLVDLEDHRWQELEIPLQSFGLADSLLSLDLAGNFGGTFYLDDIRLVAARPSRPATAVQEAHTAPLPRAFSLQPNYPNPFNGSTVIRFSVPERGPVELAVYNLAGQWVATLVRGEREVGTHAVTWEGRD
ncbi:MAG: CRTAC1 family protein, partial [Candidatus Latescibacterota bacterium]